MAMEKCKNSSRGFPAGFLTDLGDNGKILPLMPPSSRGPGRSPFKAKTRVRISLEAQAHQGGFSDHKTGFRYRSRISVEALKNHLFG